MRPLENILVLEFCQYMAGPSAGLRLADLGARVIKIEKPGSGDSGRRLAIQDLYAGDNSVLFHTINRNKESYTADLKDPKDLERVRQLIARADVLTHNFRPGVMERLGLGYEVVRNLHPKIIYGVITGYGKKGPWKDKPGQDLLVQAISGLTWLAGDSQDPPTAFGVSIADTMCGAHLVQGILAALFRRQKTRQGALIEVNLLASLLDFQFEVLTTYLNDGGQSPVRAAKGNAHSYLSAPYGIYETRDGYLALAMEELGYLGTQLGCQDILAYPDKQEWFQKRDEIHEKLERFLKEKATAEWLAILEPADVWCADVYDYQRFLNHEAFKVLQMTQTLAMPAGQDIMTTRCPIRIDGEALFSARPGPQLGEHTGEINKEFGFYD